MQIEQITTATLVPYARNSRTHTAEQITQVANSITEFGFTNPVLIDADNGIIAGHGRVMAATQLGMEQVPCIRLSHLSEAQKRGYIIADNKLAENSGWDEELLALELGELVQLDYDIELLGFDEKELLQLMPADETAGLTDEDAVPSVPQQPITCLGDVWLCGDHRVMCGDSTSIAAVEVLMNGVKADVLFTDPPYGMFLNADYSSMHSKFKGALGGNRHENVIGDHDDFDPALITSIFLNFGYCKEIFLWGADYYSEHLTDKNGGSWVVWDKRGDDSADKMFGSTFELCWSKAKHKRIIARVKWAGLFGMEKEHDKKRVHPTQKPVALVDWFFDYFNFCDARVVVDLFGGSGSTLLASEKTNRLCRMMELDPKYCDVIVKRWEQYTGKQATLADTKNTFDQIKAQRTQ